MIDKQGKIKGRVSIVDIVIVVAILALAAGFMFRRLSPHIATMLQADVEFYVTFEVQHLRGIIVDDALEVGSLIFEQHDRQALGTIVGYERFPAWGVIQFPDGTASRGVMEERYNIRVTIAATGSLTTAGYNINGVRHVGAGGGVVLINNRVFLPTARVYSVSEERPVQFAIAEE